MKPSSSRPAATHGIALLVHHATAMLLGGRPSPLGAGEGGESPYAAWEDAKQSTTPAGAEPYERRSPWRI
jgi:hypothetical protein